MPTHPLRSWLLLLLAGLLLVACSPDDPARSLAREACENLAQLSDLDFDDPDTPDRVEELTVELEAIGARVEASGLSDEELQAAFEAECPDIFRQLAP